MKPNKHCILTYCLVIFIGCFVPAICRADIQTEGVPLAVIPETVYEFPTVIDGQEVIHDFIIQNQGTAVLKVERVKTG
jgi:hypothetical protein